MIDLVSEEIKAAMKNKEKEKLSVLRYLKSLLLENKTSKNPRPDLDIVLLHQKKLKDSLESFPQGSEQRLQVEKEMDFLKEYLPKGLTEDEVVKIIKNIIEKSDAPQFGQIMKELTPQIKGQFDGKLASELVKKVLG